MKAINRYLFVLMAALVALPAALRAQDATPEGIVLKKYVVDGDEPYTYKINLEAFVTGETTTLTKRDNLDVVLVLDYSDSMKGSKATNLQNAVKSFVDQLAAYAGNKENVVQLAVIPFARYAYDLFNIRKDKNGKPEGINYDWRMRDDGVTFIMDENYGSINSFKSVTKSNKEKIKSLIVAPNSDAFNNNIMHYDGSENCTSFIDNGMILGVHTLQTLPTSRDSKKFMIVFTDGAPNDCDQPQGAIDIAYIAKKGGAEIYTVGLSANSYLPEDLSKMKASQFLSYLSSNYPNAQMNDGHKMIGASKASSDKYFTAANDASGLTDIFTAIGTEISGGADAEGLTAQTTTVIDVVSSDFKLPDGADGSNITLQVAPCTGENETYTGSADRYTFGTAVEATSVFGDINALVGTFDTATNTFTPEADGKTVQVTGFDFSENYVGIDNNEGTPEPHGYKLIISFVIEIEEDCAGGSNVDTNTDASGIYVDLDGDGTPEHFAKFDVPVAKIPNIVIIKYGLVKGESATYDIYTINSEGVKSLYPITVVATQTSDAPDAPCVARVKIRKPGRYEVVETNWSWAYTASDRDKTYAKDDADKSSTSTATWNAMGYGAHDKGYQAEIPTIFGTVVPDGTQSIIRNVNDFTEDTFVNDTYSYIGTQYIFRAKPRKDVPPHGENEHNNVFYTIKPSK